MKLNLKALGLALLAVFATSAMVAQSASADALHHEFEVTKAPAVLTGTNVVTGSTSNHAFSVSGGAASLVCTHATFIGTQKEKVQDTLSVYPTYTGCTIPGIGNATVENKGCTYNFESDTSVTVSEVHATVSLDCDHVKSITVKDNGGLCTIHFSDTHEGSSTTVNQNLHGVVYKNEVLEGGKHAVEIVMTMTGGTYIATGGFCAFLGIESGTHHDWVTTGNMTVQAFEDTGSATQTGNHVFSHNNVDVGATVKLETEN